MYLLRLGCASREMHILHLVNRPYGDGSRAHSFINCAPAVDIFSDKGKQAGPLAGIGHGI
jgi:hypothetical protein